MSRRKRQRRNDTSEVWDCRFCNIQMMGGPRCMQHNPTPEQREASPEQYRSEQYAPSYKQVP